MELRPISPNEIEVVSDLKVMSFAHDGIPEVPTLEEVTEELDDDHVVLATDTRVVEIDGEIVGAAWIYHLPSELREERCYINGMVAPQHRGAGAGSVLMTWATERATERLLSSGNNLSKYVRVDHFDFIEDAHRLYAKMGFEPIRYYDELLRPLTDLPARSEPDGVRIVPWSEDRTEEIRAVKNDAFADHWGSTPSSPKEWQKLTNGYGSRLDLSFIALSDDGNGDAIVAHCLNSRYPDDDELLGRSDGWIDNLGTLASWRGRGIATALMIHSLHAFADAGLTHASIGVDSENPTGAAELYRNLGFQPNQRSITHQIKL